MRHFFGDSFFKAFIPPYNFIDAESQEILAKHNFKFLSSGNPMPHLLADASMISLPAYIDIIEEYSPLRYKPLPRIIQEINYYRGRD